MQPKPGHIQLGCLQNAITQELIMGFSVGRGLTAIGTGGLSELGGLLDSGSTTQNQEVLETGSQALHLLSSCQSYFLFLDAWKQ